MRINAATNVRIRAAYIDRKYITVA